MAITEIPPAQPSAPQTSRDRSSALQVDAPVLLLQLQDELSRSRRREAFWISVIIHLLLAVAIVAGPKYLPSSRSVVLQGGADLIKERDLTFLELPPDAQKVTRRPNTNIVSDKDRIATSRKPTIDRKTLQELLEARRPGPPGPPAQPGPEARPQPTPPAVAQASPPATGAAGAPPAPATPPENTSQAPRLESLRDAARQAMGGGTLSPGSAIEQAARATAGSRGGGSGSGGEYGLGKGTPAGSVQSDLDILSDTMGVDFGPYLSRVLHDVRINWYNLIPEVARAPLMKRGKVSIEFAIMRNGQVAGMRLTGPSGDVSLDRAAWGGITASNPFPPLPGEFRGSYLALRFHFYYNPERNELR